jgi:hypothetical protein
VAGVTVVVAAGAMKVVVKEAVTALVAVAIVATVVAVNAVRAQKRKPLMAAVRRRLNKQAVLPVMRRPDHTEVRAITSVAVRDKARRKGNNVATVVATKVVVVVNGAASTSTRSLRVMVTNSRQSTVAVTRGSRVRSMLTARAILTNRSRIRPLRIKPSAKKSAAFSKSSSAGRALKLVKVASIPACRGLRRA